MLKVITVWQPYASLSISGAKGWETRTRRCHYRGTVAIHAAKGWDRDWWNLPAPGPADYGTVEQVRAELLVTNVLARVDDDSRLQPIAPTGAVIGLVDVVDCLPVLSERTERTEPRITVSDDGARLLWHQTGGDGDGLFDTEPVDISDQLPVGRWVPGMWALRQKNPQLLREPVPAAGSQIVPWPAPPAVEAAVLDQLPEGVAL